MPRLAGIAVRILFRHLPVGATLAWLIVLFVLPILGPPLYLFIGENRLGQKRADRWRVIHDLYREWQAGLKRRAAIDWSRLHPRAESLAIHGESITGFAALQGHEVELLPGWDLFVDALIADIEAAQRTCHLEFYIWDSAGRVGEIYTALARAAARGVICRVLVQVVPSGPGLNRASIHQLLLSLQESYLEESVDVYPEAWRLRPATERVAEGVLRLLGPML